jgi:hypothetical protein
MIASVLLMWTLSGLWGWLNVMHAIRERPGYSWALVAAMLLSGPAVWIIMLFSVLHELGSAFPVVPRARVKVPPRHSAPNRDWFTPQGTSRN